MADRPLRAMAFLLNLIFSVAFAGAVGGAVHLWRAHLDTARRDGMQALAARRGWALTITGERLGRAGALRLVPRGGLPWIAETRPGAGGPVTDYEAEEPRWAEGTLILVAVEPQGSIEPPPEGSQRLVVLSRERALRDLLGEEVARLAAPLAPVPAPEGLTALAAADPTLRLDLADLGKAMKAFAPIATGPRGSPVLILSPEGMRLRLRHPIKRHEHMERFLDLAFELSRLIGP